jgi:hypothetical protein
MVTRLGALGVPTSSGQYAAITAVLSEYQTVGSSWPPHSRMGALPSGVQSRKSLVLRSIRRPYCGLAAVGTPATGVGNAPSGLASASSAAATRTLLLIRYGLPNPIASNGFAGTASAASSVVFPVTGVVLSNSASSGSRFCAKSVSSGTELGSSVAIPLA